MSEWIHSILHIDDVYQDLVRYNSAEVPKELLDSTGECEDAKL